MANSSAMSDFKTGAKKRLVVSAKTAQPNTAETDACPVVDHIVYGEVDGVEYAVVVTARDPLWAMSMVATMPAEEFENLKRAPAEV